MKFLSKLYLQNEQEPDVLNLSVLFGSARVDDSNILVNSQRPLSVCSTKDSNLHLMQFQNGKSHYKSLRNGSCTTVWASQRTKHQLEDDTRNLIVVGEGYLRIDWGASMRNSIIGANRWDNLALCIQMTLLTLLPA